MTNIAIPGVSNWDLALRALAVNGTTAACVVFGVAGVYSVINAPKPLADERARRRAFLAAIGHTDVPVNLMLKLAESKEPIAILKEALLETNDPDTTHALRAAYLALVQ